MVTLFFLFFFSALHSIQRYFKSDNFSVSNILRESVLFLYRFWKQIPYFSLAILWGMGAILLLFFIPLLITVVAHCCFVSNFMLHEKLGFKRTFEEEKVVNDKVL